MKYLLMLALFSAGQTEYLLGCGIAVVPSRSAHYLLDKFRIKFAITDTLHHGKVLEVVMSLE